MAKPNGAVNAGVHGATGIEFQKHCALYLLFEEYENLNDTKYFICIEHKDDFLFCYQDKEGLVHSIDCYQAKKSSVPWTLSQELLGLVAQMTGVGLELHGDIIPKTEKYEHKLIFITNNSITLNNGVKKGDLKKTLTINEGNSQERFVDLDKEISNNIKTKVECILKKETKEVKGLEQLERISMRYIDIPKTSKDQKMCLIGKCNIIFGDKINDHKAAVDTMLLLFRDIENTLNQGNISKLMDESKRIDCQVIKDGFNLLTTKKMAFNLWREEKNHICKKLNIPISKQNSFRLDFENSFDRFKDLEEQEHIKILSFVRKNKGVFDVFTDEIECIQELCKKCEKTLASQLPELSVKAAIYAAYIEEREVHYEKQF